MTSKEIIKLLQIRTKERKEFMQFIREKEGTSHHYIYCTGAYDALRIILLELGAKELKDNNE